MISKHEINQLKYYYELVSYEELEPDELNEVIKLRENNLPLPPDIARGNSENGEMAFYREIPSELSDEERNLYIQLKMLRTQTTIKNILMFFFVLSIVGFSIGVILLLSAL